MVTLEKWCGQDAEQIPGLVPASLFFSQFMADNTKPNLVVAFSTAASPEEARRIASALVAEELAACVNLVDDIHSIYQWRGAIESAVESLILIKTRANLIPAIELRLRELHSYEVPELVAVPIGDGAQPYLDWLIASSHDSRKTS
jgi:periplasmic divalent cation tolerance protein